MDGRPPPRRRPSGRARPRRAAELAEAAGAHPEPGWTEDPGHGSEVQELARRRLDREMVRRGLVPTRQEAQARISAGQVLVAGAPASKAARLVGPAEPIVVAGPRSGRFVGRGGEKLDAALGRFGVAVAGRRALDLGASTGGFTDCLLQRGAASVVALDVGYGQLHERLRADPRVTVRERTNARDLRAGDIEPAPDLVVADLSFISLRAVLPAVLAVCAPRADLVLLVKPQFEAGREEASRARGVITDPRVRRRALAEVAAALSAQGAAIMGAMASPLAGAAGNVEFLLHAMAPPGPAAGGGLSGPALEAALAEAVGACAGADRAGGEPGARAERER